MASYVASKVGGEREITGKGKRQMKNHENKRKKVQRKRKGMNQHLALKHFQTYELYSSSGGLTRKDIFKKRRENVRGRVRRGEDERGR